MQKRLIALLLALMMLLFMTAAAAADGVTLESFQETDGQRLLKSYDKASKSWIYVSFGRFPQTKEGDIQPVLWRVLYTENNQAFLLSEYVLDFSALHTDHNNTKYYKDLMIYTYLNTTMLDMMVNDAEKRAIRHSDELGYLFMLDTREFMTNDYGFRSIKTEVCKERECAPTAWAMTRPKAYRDTNGKTWYWTRETRELSHEGYQWILGYNGHISMSGFLRVGGIRPAMYLDMGMLDNATGSGTANDPYVFELSR